MDTINKHYREFDESQRLNDARGQLERIRSEEIITRYLPDSPAVIADVGGGTGVYARWLAEKGYEVYLIDLVAHHVAQARDTDERKEQNHIARYIIADARELPLDDASVDVVLMLGPLYHLPNYDDRLTALRHALRVLKPDGIVIAAAISRLASLIDGKIISEIDDPVFDEIVDQDLDTGHHTNPTDNPNYFTEAHFHDPATLQNELEAAGFRHDLTAAVEGPAFLLQDLDERLNDPSRRAMLLECIRRIESDPSAMAVTAHLLTVGTKTS
ncbi:MAG: methyltransferase domain-containing protein [candidate division Zixibacteria bacterium]|nr:methyltransferase domain-containing protein [candidate division Zixibacteria bacterium]